MSKLSDILNDNAATLFCMGQDHTKGDGSASQVDEVTDKAKQQIEDLFLELVGSDVTAIDTSDQSYWGEDYKRTHDMQVEYHNNLLKRLRQKAEEL